MHDVRPVVASDEDESGQEGEGKVVEGLGAPLGVERGEMTEVAPVPLPALVDPAAAVLEGGLKGVGLELPLLRLPGASHRRALLARQPSALGAGHVHFHALPRERAAEELEEEDLERGSMRAQQR